MCELLLKEEEKKGDKKKQKKRTAAHRAHHHHCSQHKPPVSLTKDVAKRRKEHEVSTGEMRKRETRVKGKRPASWEERERRGRVRKNECVTLTHNFLW